MMVWRCPRPPEPARCPSWWDRGAGGLILQRAGLLGAVGAARIIAGLLAMPDKWLLVAPPAFLRVSST